MRYTGSWVALQRCKTKRHLNAAYESEDILPSIHLEFTEVKDESEKSYRLR